MKNKKGKFLFYLKLKIYLCVSQNNPIMISHTIKIQHETFGVIVNESFSNGVQFKLFLKMVNACLETKSNLDFFNGVDFLVHVPYKHLVDSIILTSNNEYTLTEHLINKSKIEQ